MSANNKPSELDTFGPGGEPHSDTVVVYATFPSREAALICGQRMVEDKLAGCINVLPAMTSIYAWHGKTETAEEAVLIAKLAAEGAGAAVAFITANHPYDMPAVLVLPVVGGSAAYLAWLRSGTRFS